MWERLSAGEGEEGGKGWDDLKARTSQRALAVWLAREWVSCFEALVSLDSYFATKNELSPFHILAFRPGCLVDQARQLTREPPLRMHRTRGLRCCKQQR